MEANPLQISADTARLNQIKHEAEKRRQDVASKRDALARLSRMMNLSFYRSPGGKVTVAYIVERDMITVSVAHRNPSDRDCKITGKYIAATRFHDGEFIRMRMPKASPFTYKVSPKQFIQAVFNQ